MALTSFDDREVTELAASRSAQAVASLSEGGPAAKMFASHDIHHRVGDSATSRELFGEWSDERGVRDYAVVQKYLEQLARAESERA
jgi:hypothetical protein